MAEAGITTNIQTLLAASEKSLGKQKLSQLYELLDEVIELEQV